MINKIVPFVIAVCIAGMPGSVDSFEKPATHQEAEQRLLPAERLAGDGVWVDPALERQMERSGRVFVRVWFDEQFLGDGKAYGRRAKEFAGRKRGELRSAVVKTLKALSVRSYNEAKADIEKLIHDGTIGDFQPHWIVNGFSCWVKPDGLEALKSVTGVKKIFVARRGGMVSRQPSARPAVFEPIERESFDAGRYNHPWYSRYLLADRVWKEFGVTGEGTLNIVHDFTFEFSDNVTNSLYRNPAETPGNGKDDDGNGLVDDYHGFNFDRNSANLTMTPGTHGFMCAAIICGAGLEGKEFEFGIAPRGRWAGVIASQRLEAAVEWTIEQGADTYSMSFSIPGLGEYRSHWRKVMEHGSFCGVYFVSGAGNFAQQVAVPVQMRTPEDIPEVVFAAAGVQRNFSRTPFSSKGPVRWQTQHYRDGMVQKPEVCAFNNNLPALLTDGTARSWGASGNSFAGPMFCGAIALMLSADPELLPWDLKEIITSTATDVAVEGVDNETGHGLINCYRAVKEVLRRKAVREGRDASAYTGRTPGDTLDIKTIKDKLKSTTVIIGRVQRNSQAARLGLKAGDIFVSYNGDAVTNRTELQSARKRAAGAKSKNVIVVVRRGDETLERIAKPGPLGISPAVVFEDPAFQR
jgi:Subtilase family/PDZ domain